MSESYPDLTRDASSPTRTNPVGARRVRGPVHKYHSQRLCAQTRGIEWLFTFDTWWQVWQESGKWEQRGQGIDQYVMSRPGDKGPYAPHNVQIVTGRENLREMNARCLPKRLGSGKGWKFNPKNKTRPYTVLIAHRWVGAFPTPGEATAAYRQAVSLLLKQAETA